MARRPDRPRRKAVNVYYGARYLQTPQYEKWITLSVVADRERSSGVSCWSGEATIWGFTASRGVHLDSHPTPWESVALSCDPCMGMSHRAVPAGLQNQETMHAQSAS